MMSRNRNNFFSLTILFILFVSIGVCQKSSVYFKSNDFSLDNKSKQLIDSLSKINDIERIFLQGHCDSIGNNEFNDALSVKRVNEVRTYYISKGFPEQLFEIKALGKRASVNKNATQTERALNRRVEIEIFIKPKVITFKPDTISTSIQKSMSANEVEITINGIVLNEKKQPLIAEISLNDKNGNEINTVLSDKDGKYTFKAIVKKKEDYSLVFLNDSSFVSSKIINASNARKPYKNLKTILPILKDGNKYTLENLNFEGDTSQLIAASLSSLEALYKLMKKNKSLIIQIEGHVNYPSHFPNSKRPATSNHYFPPGMNRGEFNQWLSNERAKMIYTYLINKGIKDKRMSTIGYGATRMLFPDAYTESEMAQNRRVEINVISYKKKPVE
jgi:outer membrane protein OmpA-like peptidoglycan-associated protein